MRLNATVNVYTLHKSFMNGMECGSTMGNTSTAINIKNVGMSFNVLLLCGYVSKDNCGFQCPD